MFKFKFKLWLIPIFIFVLLTITVVTTALIYHKTLKDHEVEIAAQIANTMSRSMSHEIEHRLQALKVVASSIHKQPSKSEFANLAKSLHGEYKDLFAINFVTTDGIIRRVYPLAANKAAEGKNLLERPDVSPYLIESKATASARASHRILTYQKIYAVTLYVPLYDKTDTFIGWMNGVLAIDNFLHTYIQEAEIPNLSARLRWLHPAVTNTLTYNWNNPRTYHTTTHKIMNQNLQIDLALGPSELDEKRNTLYLTTLFLRVISILIISFLVVLLTVSRIKLNRANEQLSFKNNMLNSLSHDISSPLNSLNLIIYLAIKKNAIDELQREKIDKLFKTIDDMLKSVRMLHSYEIGAKSMSLENISARKAIEDAIAVVEQIANAKNVNFSVSPALNGNLLIKANAHTLVNNVLLNILSNAIKFSNKDGTIYISHKINEEQVSLIFINQGQQICKKDLDKFKLKSFIESRPGTHGELGTGLGLLQITGFMRIYGGCVNIENIEPSGTKATLTFKKS